MASLNFNIDGQGESGEGDDDAAIYDQTYEGHRQQLPPPINMNHLFQPTEFGTYADRGPLFYDYAVPNIYEYAYNDIDQQQDDPDQQQQVFDDSNEKNSNNHMIPNAKTDAWTKKFNLLKEFKAEKGHTNVPLLYSENKSLGRWVNKQRELYKKYTHNLTIENVSKKLPCALNDKRIKRLNEIGFVWVVGKGQHAKLQGIFEHSESHARNWEENYSKLKQFQENFGHVNVDCDTFSNDNSTDVDIRALSRWLNAQKKKYMEVQDGKLTAGETLQNRFERLSSLGVAFSFDDAAFVSSEYSSTSPPTRVGNHIDENWDKKYQELCHYFQIYGHANVSHTDKNYASLARWVSTQREQYKLQSYEKQSRQNPGKQAVTQSALSEEKIRLLENIDFSFSVQNTLWDQRYAELEDYKRVNGHSNVSYTENRGLYSWSKLQQRYFKDYMQGRMTSNILMTPEKVQKLENIDFDWQYCFEPLSEKELQDVISRTKEKKQNRNSYNSPKKVDFNSDVETAQLARLESINPLDESQLENETRETDALDDLIPIDSKKLDISSSNLSNNNSSINNSLHKKGTKPKVWDEKFDQLLIFHAEHGHCRVPKNPESQKLRTWIKVQREDYKKFQDGKSSPMSEYRINKLQSIGFEWSMKENSDVAWMKKFNMLKQFQEENGHADVPQAYTANKPLGKWVSKQRQVVSSLSEERMRLLLGIGFRFNIGRGNGREKSWNISFGCLEEFQDKYGHTNVPLCYDDLGKWVYEQRLAMWRGTLAKTRLKKLQSINFSFHVKPKKRSRAKDDAHSTSVSKKTCLDLN